MSQSPTLALIPVIFFILVHISDCQAGVKGKSGVPLTRHGRIYMDAPVGTPVTMRPEARDPKQCDRYFNILPINQTDFRLFKIDDCLANLTVISPVTRGIGSTYRMIVRATHKLTETRQLFEYRISVTAYNEYPPSFPKAHYSQEILDRAPPGTFMMQLEAQDNPPSNSSDQIVYFVQSSSDTSTNPWFPSKGDIPVSINTTTGQLFVESSLMEYAPALTFFVGAADQGSPQRSSRTKITLHIRNMSSPRDVEIVKTTESSILACWRAPIYGRPDGYQITYFPRNNPTRQKQLVLSSQEILNRTESILALKNFGSYQRTKEENSKLNPRRNLYCVTMDQLAAFTLYSISVRGWAFGNKLSMTKDPVTVITQKKDCTRDTCQHGVCQEQNAAPGFLCRCVKGFTGQRCQTPEFPCEHFNVTCVHGKCNANRGFPPLCDCNPGYMGHRCDQVDACAQQNLCHNGATCVSNANETYTCICPPTHSGATCQTPKLTEVFCDEEKTYQDNIQFKWPRTPSGVEIAIKCPKVGGDVPPRMVPTITRLCKRVSDTEASWDAPNMTMCQKSSEDVLRVQMETEQISNLSEISLHKNASSRDLTAAVDKIANVIRNKITSKKVARKVAQVMSNILKGREKLNDSSEDAYKASGKLRHAIEAFTENIALKPSEQVWLREDNLVIAAKVLKKEDVPPVIEFNPVSQNSSQTQFEGLWLSIPKDVVDESEEENVRFQFVSFDNDHVFRGEKTAKRLNMPVISASVKNLKVKDLGNPVQYTIPFIKDSQLQPKCVYWDVHDEAWSEEGLNTVHSANGDILCESTHLTAFSVLLDPVAAPHSRHSDILSTITYILLTLSTLALTITIATFLLFKQLRRDRSGIIVMNLSLSLLILNVVFILVSVSQPSYQLCPLLGGLLHYCVLTAFCWMLVEAKNMHQLLVTVFPSVETHYILKRLLFAWGSPVVFVVIAYLWDPNVYRNDNVDFCVMTATNAPIVYYMTYFVPICVVLVINCIVFVLVARILCQRRPGSIKQKNPNARPQQKPLVTFAQFRGAVTIVALLGVTWVMGALAIGPVRIAFQYIFCLTTPLQGLIIFMVRVIQSGEARNSWYFFLKDGSRKHRATPTSQRTHSSSQAHSSSGNTQSTASTGRSVLSSAVRAARRLSLVNNASVLGLKGKLSSTKKPVEARKSSAPMLPENPRRLDRLNSESSQSHQTEEDATQETKDAYPELEMQRTGSDLLLSISKLLPLDLTSSKPMYTNHKDSNGSEKGIEPYDLRADSTPAQNTLTRASSENIVYINNSYDLSKRRMSLSNNNLDDLKNSQQNTHLLNPD